ncbi:MAG: hypothetical protein VX908_02180 [Planctomycetota bacterium]|nr:hypothetical protein [Planctomycetota bacterium]
MEWSCPARQVTRVLLLLATALTVLSSGCVESYRAPQTLRPKTERLVIQHSSGGTHYRMLIDGQAWYQLFGSELLVMNPTNGRVINRQILSRVGGNAPATDMVMHEGELWVVLRDVGVVRLTLEDPFRPWAEEMIPSGELGIQPRHVNVIGQGVVVSGVGGVVNPSTRQQLVDSEGEVMAVVEMSEGPVYCEGRRIYRVHHASKNDEYLGSASDLFEIPETTPWGDDAIVFVRHEANGSLVGIMGDDLRELDSKRSTVAIPGHVRQVRYEVGQLLVVSDTSVRMYKHHDGALVLVKEYPLSGTHDASIASESRLAISGDFGRGTLRLKPDIDGEAGTIDLLFPEPAGLTRAVSDGRNILAASDRGAWLYRIGEGARPAPVDESRFRPPPRQAVTFGWQARILDDGTRVEVTTPVGHDVLHAPGGGYFRSVAAADGVIWLGHDTGIIMLRLPNEPVELPSDWESMSEAERLDSGLGPLEGMTKLSIRLDGPVVFLDPLMLGGGVAYVSMRGGFGVVVEELK